VVVAGDDVEVGRADAVLRVFGDGVMCFGRTKLHQPKHPGRIPSNSPLVEM
jgi:hypothetical protein